MNYMMHYRTPFWKLALGGVMAGALLYFFPFLLPALAFFFLLGLMFRLFFGRRRYWHPALAERWKNMTGEERKAFTEKHAHGCCGYRYQPAEVDPSTPKQ